MDDCNEGLDDDLIMDDVEGLGWSVTGVRGEEDDDGVCATSWRNMRRSTMTLALRISTP